MAFIQITQRQGRVPVTIFQLLDRINLGNFAELEKISKGAYDSGTRDLVIDLSQIESLTSIGVRALVIVHKMLSTDKEKHLKLAGAGGEDEVGFAAGGDGGAQERGRALCRRRAHLGLGRVDGDFHAWVIPCRY